MLEIRNKAFHALIDRGDVGLVDGIVLDGCCFDFCALSETQEIGRRTIARNVTVRNCVAQNHVAIGPAILENVFVDGLGTPTGIVLFWDPLFKHVRFQGRIGRIKINPYACPEAYITPALQAPFDAAKRAYYAGVDWAIDISNAQFQLFEMSGVPTELVRRDPETQVIVRREACLGPEWRREINPDNVWLDNIDVWLKVDKVEPTRLLVAPKGTTRAQFEKDLRDLHVLRRIGVADPD